MKAVEPRLCIDIRNQGGKDEVTIDINYRLGYDKERYVDYACGVACSHDWFKRRTPIKQL
ncbi:hypothetical protein D3C77_589320 [compost metagenome]